MRAVPILTASLLIAGGCGSDPTTSGAPIDPTEITVTEAPSTPADTTDPDQGGGEDNSAPTSTTGEPATTVTVPPTSDPDTTAAPTTTAPGDGSATTPQQLAEVAIDDLMTRVGAARDEIGIRSTDEVTWRDGAIGCPDPDFSYTQALVRGVRVVLDHEGFAYHYHQGGGRDLFYCPTPEAPLDEATADH